MSDFSDRPFVAGSLIGLRAFDVDAYGRLVGPSVRQVFRPGENQAECRKAETSMGSIFTSINQAFYMPPPPRFLYNPATGDVSVSADEPAPTPSISEAAVEKPLPKHTLAGVGCSCGFYAYFDGRNDYKRPSNVAAIIEGYGVCTVGTRGFRASKARLVALVQPKKGLSPLMVDRLGRNYPDVPLYARRSEALAAHPLTPPPEPTPADEDFWDRPAVIR